MPAHCWSKLAQNRLESFDVELRRVQNVPPVLEHRSQDNHRHRSHDQASVPLDSRVKVHGERDEQKDQRINKAPEALDSVRPGLELEGFVSHVLVRPQCHHRVDLADQERHHGVRAADGGGHQKKHLQFEAGPLEKIVLYPGIIRGGFRHCSVESQDNLQQHGRHESVGVHAIDAQVGPVHVCGTDPLLLPLHRPDAHVQQSLHQSRLAVHIGLLVEVALGRRRPRGRSALGGEHAGPLEGEAQPMQRPNQRKPTCEHCQQSAQRAPRPPPPHRHCSFLLGDGPCVPGHRRLTDEGAEA
mmetsp:Transcript_54443/g.151018  ORF Transcript_54443/g.151018 Transcript_54443/m.151018 type:complete len:299 (+) Transcript_54443:206-1102(+)